MGFEACWDERGEIEFARNSTPDHNCSSLNLAPGDQPKRTGLPSPVDSDESALVQFHALSESTGEGRPSNRPTYRNFTIEPGFKA